MTRILTALHLFIIAGLCGGCLVEDYSVLKPSETAGYTEVVPDTPDHSGRWPWVRGRIAGELTPINEGGLDGREEEILLVSIQEGEKVETDQMGMKEAWIYVCNLPGRRTQRSVLDKIRLDYLPFSPLSSGVAAANEPDSEMVGGKIRLADLDNDGGQEIIVSLNGRPNGTVNCIHYVLTFRQGKLVPLFKTSGPQYECILKTADIDSDGESELIMDEAVFLPPSDAKRLPPSWPHIYHGFGTMSYRENNAAFPKYFDQTLLSLYEDLAVREDILDKCENGLHEFYIGSIYAYRENKELSDLFLSRYRKKRLEFALPGVSGLPLETDEKPKSVIMKSPVNAQ